MPSLIATLGLNAAAFYAGAKSAEGAASKLGGALKSHLGSKLAGIVGIAALEQSAQAMLELGSNIQDISNRLGISTDGVQRWDYALKQNGSNIQEAIPFFQKLAIAREKALSGNEDAIADFQKLGVSLAQLKNSRLEDIGATIAKSFESGDPQQLMASLIAVGGKGAGAMAAAFRDGLADALGEASIIPQKDIEDLDAAADAISRLKNETISIFAPLVADVANFVTGTLDAIKIVLGGLIGGMQGVIETFSSMKWSDFLNPFKAFGTLGKGALEGSAEGFSALANEKLDREDAAKKKRERLAKGNRKPFDAEALEAAATKKEAEKAAKEAEAAQKKAEREKEKAQRDAEKKVRDEKRLNEAVDREAEREMADNAKLGKHSVSSFQQIGGFLGNFGLAAGPEAAAMNAQVRSEEHLRIIREQILKKKDLTPEPDVEF